MPLEACAWCHRPMAPKAANFEVHFRNGEMCRVHGTCLGDIVHQALEQVALARERNRLENGPTLQDVKAELKSAGVDLGREG